MSGRHPVFNSRFGISFQQQAPTSHSLLGGRSHAVSSMNFDMEVETLFTALAISMCSLCRRFGEPSPYGPPGTLVHFDHHGGTFGECKAQDVYVFMRKDPHDILHLADIALQGPQSHRSGQGTPPFKIKVKDECAECEGTGNSGTEECWACDGTGIDDRRD